MSKEQAMQPQARTSKILNIATQFGMNPFTMRMMAADPLLATPIHAVTSPFLLSPPISTAKTPLIVLYGPKSPKPIMPTKNAAVQKWREVSYASMNATVITKTIELARRMKPLYCHGIKSLVWPLSMTENMPKNVNSKDADATFPTVRGSWSHVLKSMVGW